MNHRNLEIIILAAGKGQRMNSDLPKVLHTVAGIPMLARIIETAQQLNPKAIHVIYGFQGVRVKESLAHLNVNWVEQSQQLGTGHAAKQAMPFIQPDSLVLILSGDVPAIQPNTLKTLITSAISTDSLALLTSVPSNPQGLGRIIRNPDGYVSAIIEEKDATDEIRRIQEIYTGICCIQAKILMSWLSQLNCDNAGQEYYLTQIIYLAAQEKFPITSCIVKDPMETQGINDKLQLNYLERYIYRKTAEEFLRLGINIADPARTDIRGQLECGSNVTIDINTIFEGKVTVGNNTHIGPNCLIKNTTIGDNCSIMANCVIENSVIGNDAQVGPFARLRPQTILNDHCKVGNFVETKNANFGLNSKASHLSYLGDVTIGQDVNIGAGTITCNYDGANKHQTIIEDGVFVGSDTQLIAPVTIGKNATIGAGSSIRKNVPPNELAITEAKQKHISGWKRPTKIDSATTSSRGACDEGSQ